MAVISGIGTYVPRLRLDRKAMYKAVGWVNPAAFKPGFKAVANWDEDSVTMAVAAARNLGEKQGKGWKQGIDAVYFATATPSFAERPGAGVIATALDLPETVRTADFSNSPNALFEALSSAIDAVDAGASKVLVVTGDTRIGKPGSQMDYLYGDGGAALLVCGHGEGLEVIARAGMHKDFMDHWRGNGEGFDRQWEDRWIRDEAFGPFLTETGLNLLKKGDISGKKIKFASLPGLYVRDLRGIARRLELNENVVTRALVGEVGYTGNPQSLLLLSRAATDIGPGDTGLIMGFGYGAAGVLLRATKGYDKSLFTGVEAQIADGEPFTNYTKYVGLRGQLQVDKGIRGEVQAFTALNLAFRKRRQILALVGSRCTECGTPQYPAQRVCVNPKCRAVDHMEDYSFADRMATVFSFTEDNLAYTPSPPAIYALVDFDGGGRFWFDITDSAPGRIKVGSRVRFVFRIRYVDKDRGLRGYFYKAVAVNGGKDA